MSEQEIREGMLLAVWDEPPLDFDPDTLIRRVEQKKSRRRALVTVGVATALIAVASFSLPSLLPRDQDARLGAETTASSSSPPSSVSNERRVRRIGDQLTAALEARVPAVSSVYATFNPGRMPVNPAYQTQAPRWDNGERDFSGYLHFTDGIGPTALRVMVYSGSFSSKDFCIGASTCDQLKTADGSFVHFAESTEGDSQVQSARVVRVFDSGHVVELSAHAFNPSNGVGQRATVPIRVAVLTQLVTDPGITWE